ENFIAISPSEEQSPLTDVFHLCRNQTQSTCTSRVGSNEIIGKHNCSQFVLGSVERAIACHRDDRVGDDEVRWNAGAEIENAFVDAGPVEDILGPAVTASWDDTEHVVHGQRDSG